MNISGSNVTVATSTNCWESIVAGENWKMQGSYSSFSLDPMADEYHDKNIYYLNGDKFLHANIAFPAGAFRGWFEAPKNSLNSKAFFMFGDLLLSLLAFDVFLFGTAIQNTSLPLKN